ncbi:uncharacterized protein LOC122528258 [Frieseomelitta varia]|uniref:uncharacterized protein LOC122528258 n=1 Tax=Frieseomelitta varia TaxID=561572 RepID=UPI001CB67F5C|nr:uncharacterized protein LOC122528258 [Frieseomelitta varia]
MWQSGGMGAHAANNPWMKLMGIVHKERRHHDSGSAAAAASGVQGSATTGSNDRTLNQGLTAPDCPLCEKATKRPPPCNMQMILVAGG